MLIIFFLSKSLENTKCLTYICSDFSFFNNKVEDKSIWQDKYAEYMETIPAGSTRHYKFYGWMYNEIYRGLREN